nr:MAG TPA: hypothetical protein [Siphoviridae sp. ctHdl3]
MRSKHIRAIPEEDRERSRDVRRSCSRVQLSE